MPSAGGSNCGRLEMHQLAQHVALFYKILVARRYSVKIWRITKSRRRCESGERQTSHDLPRLLPLQKSGGAICFELSPNLSL